VVLWLKNWRFPVTCGGVNVANGVLTQQVGGVKVAIAGGYTSAESVAHVEHI
jgi:hypothetical protein